MDKKQVRKELTDAAMTGIHQMLMTLRGAHYLMNAELTRQDERTLRIRVPGQMSGDGPTYFTVTVKEIQ